MKLREKVYVDTVPRGITAILGADIGGTNSNFGFFECHDNHIILLFSVHAKSQEVDDFPQLVKEILELVKGQYDINIQQALFASAGIVSLNRDWSKPTNLSFPIDAHEIKKATGLACVYIANDFEVIGYGIDLINPKDLIPVNKGITRNHANKAILGAGTGLGKCIMFWNECEHRYVPIASEGGHADFAIQDQQELNLAQFIQKSEGFDCAISWENVLSGNGIQRIYRFFHESSNDISFDEREPNPDEIFKSRNHNEHSKNTFELYTKLYGRCSKDFTLDALALGGIYIAGGIATHNVPMFEQPIFMEAFTKCGKQSHLLQKVPIHVISDYNVSLYGAAHYLVLEKMCR